MCSYYDENESQYHYEKTDLTRWITDKHQSPYGRVPDPIPIRNPPIHWIKLGRSYANFTCSLDLYLHFETFVSRKQRSSDLYLSFENLWTMVLEFCFYHNPPCSSPLRQHRWAGTPSPPTSAGQWHSASSSLDRFSASTPTSTPSSTTRSIIDLATCFDALYYLIHTAQDLTQINYDESSLRRLRGGSRIIRMPNMLVDLVVDLVTVIRSYDRGQVGRMIEGREMMVYQLEELAGWRTKEGIRLFGGLGEVVVAMREMKDWRRTKARRAVGAFWDFVFL